MLQRLGRIEGQCLRYWYLSKLVNCELNCFVGAGIIRRLSELQQEFFQFDASAPDPIAHFVARKASERGEPIPAEAESGGEIC